MAVNPVTYDVLHEAACEAALYEAIVGVGSVILIIATASAVPFHLAVRTFREARQHS